MFNGRSDEYYNVRRVLRENFDVRKIAAGKRALSRKRLINTRYICRGRKPQPYEYGNNHVREGDAEYDRTIALIWSSQYEDLSMNSHTDRPHVPTLVTSIRRTRVVCVITWL